MRWIKLLTSSSTALEQYKLDTATFASLNRCPASQLGNLGMCEMSAVLISF